MLTIFDALNPFHRGRRYRYSVLSYARSLGSEGASTPIAVVVESKESDQKRFYVVGIYPDATLASRLGTRVLEQLPHWVLAQIQEAVESGSDPMVHLAEATPYNLRFSMPDTYRSGKELERAAMDLFQIEVFGILPREVQQQRPTIPPSASVRDFFQSELPVRQRSYAR